MGNWIIKTGVSMSTAFGDRINLLWVSDLHASPDIGPFNALQASLLDSENSLILIDSNVDEIGGPVHELQKKPTPIPPYTPTISFIVILITSAKGSRMD